MGWLSNLWNRCISTATPAYDVCNSCNVDCNESIKKACQMLACSMDEKCSGVRVGKRATGKPAKRVT